MISRRLLLQSLIAQPLLAGVAHAQARVVAKPKPLPAGAVTHDWTSFLGPDAQRRLDGNEAESDAAAAARLGVPQGHELLVTGHCRRSAGVHPPRRRRRDRRVPGRGDRREPLAVQVRHGVRGSLRLQQRSAIEPGHRRHARLHDGRRRQAALPGPRVGQGGLEARSPRRLQGAAGFLRHRIARRSSRAACSSSTSARPGGPCVVGLDTATGKEVWRAGTAWGPSYASPVPAVVHGQRRVFVFAGGESNPPTGGLMSINPATGKVDFSFPWRSRSYESVNASCPVVFDNKVFVSASYRTGGALLQINPDFTHKVLWTTQEFGLHFNTPIHRDGYLYGFDGRNEPDASLACVDVATGKVVWRETAEWTETIGGRQADGRHVSRIAARRRRQLSLPRRARAPAVDGPDAEGLQGALARVAVPGARVVGAARPQPRPAVRRAEHARDLARRTGRVCSATTCAHSLLTPGQTWPAHCSSTVWPWMRP